jgi:hypothetical protein
MGRERRPVVQPQVADSAKDRYRNECDEHNDESELRRTRRPGAGEGHGEHREQQNGGERTSGAAS